MVALLLVHSFFLGWARIFARTAGYALFLGQFGAQALPYVYIGTGVLATLAALGYMKLSERLSLRRLLLFTAGFLVLGTLGLRAGLLFTRAGWLVFLLPVWYEVLFALSILEFWNLAGRLCDVRQGKRLFGLIGAGEQIAAAIGGLLVPALVATIGTPDLLLLGAVAMAGVLAALVATGRAFGGALGARADHHPPKDTAADMPSRRPRNYYVQLLFGAFGLFCISYFLIDNIFYTQAAVQYPSESELASFIGPFFAVIALLTLFAQTLLTGPIVNRFGVRVGLLTSPVVLALIASLSAAAGLGAGVTLFFWLLALLKVYSLTSSMAIDEPLFNILYQPLPAAQRVRVTAALEGIVSPVSAGVTGVSLIALTGMLGFTSRELIYALFVILAAWLGLNVLLGSRYLAMLTLALTRRRLNTVSMSIDDASQRVVLERALDNPNPGVVIYALNMLEECQPAALQAALPGLLTHGDEEVRHAALEQIGRLHVTAALPQVVESAHTDPSPTVRAAALRALIMAGGPDGMRDIRPFLGDPDREVVAAAIGGLMGSGEREAFEAAEARLAELACGAPAERLLACQALGEFTRGAGRQLMAGLLLDPDTGVRRAALAAAARAGQAAAWPAAVAALQEPRLRKAAILALGSGGNAALAAIEAAIAGPGQNRGVLAGLMEACGRIGGDRAVSLLLTQLCTPDDGLRNHVLHALRHLGYRAAAEEAPIIQEQIRAEITTASQLLAWIADMERPPAKSGLQVDAKTLPGRMNVARQSGANLLRDALTERFAQSQHRLLLLLAFTYDNRIILQAADWLLVGPALTRAYALEAIDVVLPGELKHEVMLLLENLPAEERLEKLSAAYPRQRLGPVSRLRVLLDDLEQGTDPWLQACACHMIGTWRLHELADCLPQRARDPLVRESAAWAAGRIKGEEPMLSMLEKVIVLKGAPLFAGTPHETLAAVAAVSSEVELKAGERGFSKGDPGDCMYVIVCGRLRVHDGDHTLDFAEQGEIFGEMAILDPQPRMASVTAAEDSLLLRLDQDALYELMEDRPEVARGIIAVLSRRLRARVADLTALRERVKEGGGCVDEELRD